MPSGVEILSSVMSEDLVPDYSGCQTRVGGGASGAFNSLTAATNTKTPEPATLPQTDPQSLQSQVFPNPDNARSSPYANTRPRRCDEPGWSLDGAKSTAASCGSVPVAKSLGPRLPLTISPTPTLRRKLWYLNSFDVPRAGRGQRRHRATGASARSVTGHGNIRIWSIRWLGRSPREVGETTGSNYKRVGSFARDCPSETALWF